MQLSSTMCVNYTPIMQSTRRPTIVVSPPHQGTPPVIRVSDCDSERLGVLADRTENTQEKCFLNPPTRNFSGLENPWTDFNLSPFNLRKVKRSSE